MTHARLITALSFAIVLFSLPVPPAAALTDVDVSVVTYQSGADNLRDFDITPSGTVVGCYQDGTNIYLTRSADQGLTWDSGNLVVSVPSAPDCAVAAVSDTVLLAAAIKTVYRSNDAGETWTLVKTLTGGYTGTTDGGVDLAVFDSDSWAFISDGQGTNPGLYEWVTNDAGIGFTAALQLSTQSNLDAGVTYGATDQDVVVVQDDNYFVSTDGGATLALTGAPTQANDMQNVRFLNGKFYAAGSLDGVNAAAEDVALFEFLGATVSAYRLVVNPASRTIDDTRLDAGTTADSIRIAWLDSANNVKLTDWSTDPAVDVTIFTGTIYAVLYVDANLTLVGVEDEVFRVGDVPEGLVVPAFIASNGVLRGGSMDSTGGFIVTREDNGETVYTYDAGNIGAGPIASYATLDCTGTSDGVFAWSDGAEVLTTFWDCAGDGDRNHLLIKTTALGPPEFGECGGEDLGDDDIDADLVNEFGPFELPETMDTLGVLGDLSIDWSYCLTEGGLDEVMAAWFYTDDDGRAGVYAVNIEDSLGPAPKAVSDDRTSFQLDANGGGAAALCTWQDPLGTVFGTGDGFVDDDWAGVVAGTGTGGGPFAMFTTDVHVQDDVTTNNDVEVELAVRYNNGSGIYFASHTLSCALNPAVSNNMTAVIGSDTTLRLISYSHAGAPVVLDQVARSMTHGRSAAISGNTHWTARLEGEVIKVSPTGDFSNVTAYADVSGSWTAVLGMEFDTTGTRLAFFVDNGIFVIDLTEQLCPDDATLCEPGPQDSGETQGSGCPDGYVGSFPQGCHLPSTGPAPGTLGGGVVGGITAETAVYLTIGTILLFGAVGWALTTSRRRDNGN